MFVLAVLLLIVPLIVFASTAGDTPESNGTSEEKAQLETQQQDTKPVVQTVPDIIRELSAKYGVDTNLALNIACAESKFISTAKNPYSTASGVYQFLNGSWTYYGKKYWTTLEGRSKLDARDSVELAILVLRDTGTSPWNASKWEGYGGGWANKPYEKGKCPR